MPSLHYFFTFFHIFFPPPSFLSSSPSQSFQRLHRIHFNIFGENLTQFSCFVPSFSSDVSSLTLSLQDVAQPYLFASAEKSFSLHFFEKTLTFLFREIHFFNTMTQHPIVGKKTQKISQSKSYSHPLPKGSCLTSPSPISCLLSSHSLYGPVILAGLKHFSCPLCPLPRSLSLSLSLPRGRGHVYNMPV